jgi:uncharacterized membrane protein
VRAFDLARGLAVVFMVVVHVLWHWGRPAAIESPVGTVLSFLGGPPAAPVFMALMGASIAFSRHAGPRALATRGAILIAAGYALNVTRGALPATLGLAAGVISAEEIAPFTPLRLLTSVDILQLAGCSLILIAALRLAGRPSPAWLVVGLGLVLAAPFVRGLATGIPVLDAVLTPVWGGAPNVFYAVFPWAMYPVVGAVVGEWLAGAGDRATAIRRLGLAGLALAGAGVAAIALTRPGFDVYTYWRHPPALALAILGFVLAWLWACDLVARRLPEGRVVRVLEAVGRRVTVLYVVHWLIVGWGIGLVGFRALDLGPVLVAMAVVVGLTWLLGTRRMPARRVASAGAGA